MKKFLTASRWPWLTGGLALGIIFLLAVVLVKPIGVSTQYVIADGIAWNTVSDVVQVDESAKSGYSSPNAYLNKSGGKYAAAIANPLNYGFIFVGAMLLGGAASALLTSKKSRAEIRAGRPLGASYKYKFGSNKPLMHYGMAFLGGAIALFGARLAGGCTSGHMMSGIMQTSLSGFIFTAAAFPAAIITALIIYRRSK